MQPVDVMRIKGVTAVVGNPQRVIYQSVNEFFDSV